MHSMSPSDPLGSMRQGEAKIHALQYLARQSRAAYIITHFSVSLPPQCRSKAVVYAITPRMYPRSGYILVKVKDKLWKKYSFMVNISFL